MRDNVRCASICSRCCGVTHTLVSGAMRSASIPRSLSRRWIPVRRGGEPNWSSHQTRARRRACRSNQASTARHFHQVPPAATGCAQSSADCGPGTGSSRPSSPDPSLSATGRDALAERPAPQAGHTSLARHTPGQLVRQQLGLMDPGRSPHRERPAVVTVNVPASNRACRPEKPPQVSPPQPPAQRPQPGPVPTSRRRVGGDEQVNVLVRDAHRHSVRTKTLTGAEPPVHPHATECTSMPMCAHRAPTRSPSRE